MKIQHSRCQRRGQTLPFDQRSEALFARPVFLPFETYRLPFAAHYNWRDGDVS